MAGQIFPALVVTSPTVFESKEKGAKFHASAYSLRFSNNFFPNRRYPLIQSRTCCHGRTAFGFLIDAFLFSAAALTRSGIKRSLLQSPPPMTFPALAVAISL